MSETRTAPTKADRQARRQRLAINARATALDRKLVTPEGAELTLKLSSAGKRAGAFIIDWIIIILIFIVIIFAITKISEGLGRRGDGIADALAMLVIFAVRNFYFIFFEIGRRAATPGKRLSGVRVASRNGGQLTANAILARNFVREVEVFMPLFYLLSTAFSAGVETWISIFGLLWSGLFLFMPLLNKDKLRLGDLIAGTWVIETPKKKLLGDIAKTSGKMADAETKFNFTAEQLDVYGIHELHILENLLRKSTKEVKASVAERIRKKIDWERLPDESDIDFLRHYYAGLRKNLEQKLLLGQRKADKFDT
ncbi:MAG: RDD family protein [Hyphomonadaceae bacterium]